MVDFFISRNKADREWAAWIAWQLEAAGYTTVVQDWDFLPGSNFVLEMQRAATDAKRTILVLSPDFLTSEYTAPEWAAAFANDPAATARTLVPVQVRCCKPSGLLSPIVYIDLVDRDESRAREELLLGVKQHRAKPSNPPRFPGRLLGEHPDFPGPQQYTEGVSDEREEASGSLTPETIAALIDHYNWGVRPDRDRGGWTGDVWLGIVLVPERQSAPYIAELALDDPELREELLSIMLVGSSAVFRPDRRTEVTEQQDHLAFAQFDDRTRRATATLETYINGTLIYRTVVPRRTAQSMISLADAHIIDEEAVGHALASHLTFCKEFYKQRHCETGALHLGVSLSDIAMKHFGSLPHYELNSFTIGDPHIEDPLRVPTVPLKITLADFAEPSTIAETVVRHIARQFRLSDAYYTP